MRTVTFFVVLTFAGCLWPAVASPRPNPTTPCVQVPPSSPLARARTWHPRWGHDAGYTRLYGRLEHSSLEGGFWTVVYEPVVSRARKDRYHGHFVLTVHPSVLAGFKDRDMVVITGHVETDRMGIEMSGSYYRVRTLRHQQGGLDASGRRHT